MIGCLQDENSMLYAFDESAEVSYALNDKIFGMDLPVMKTSPSAILQI